MFGTTSCFRVLNFCNVVCGVRGPFQDGLSVGVISSGKCYFGQICFFGGEQAQSMLILNRACTSSESTFGPLRKVTPSKKLGFDVWLAVAN